MVSASGTRWETRVRQVARSTYNRIWSIRRHTSLSSSFIVPLWSSLNVYDIPPRTSASLRGHLLNPDLTRHPDRHLVLITLIMNLNLNTNSVFNDQTVISNTPTLTQITQTVTLNSNPKTLNPNPNQEKDVCDCNCFRGRCPGGNCPVTSWPSHVARRRSALIQRRCPTVIPPDFRISKQLTSSHVFIRIRVGYADQTIRRRTIELVLVRRSDPTTLWDIHVAHSASFTSHDLDWTGKTVLNTRYDTTWEKLF